MRISRGWRLITSTTGRRTTALSRLRAVKDGLSITRSRTYSPMPTSTMLARKGTRQPHRSKSGPVAALITLNRPVESSSPSGTPSCGQDAIRPRRFWAPHSIDISTEPPHSPPTPIPCDDAQQRQQDRRGDPHGGDAGQAADEERRRPHQHSVVTAWPCARPGRRSGRRSPRRSVGRRTPRTAWRTRPAHRRTGTGREEQLGEDQRGRRAVEEEVVPLDGRAHRAGHHGPAPVTPHLGRRACVER